MKMFLKDPVQVSAKIGNLREGGVKLLHIIADFDRTMTHPSGMTSWACLQHCTELSKKFHEETDVLFRRFHPIEVDASLPVATKYAAMEEWWNLAHDLLLAEKVTKKTFRDIIDHAKGGGIKWRERTPELVRLCGELQIPFLIFSAGLGDLIDACIEREKWDDVHVLSNHLVFGAEGVATGFRHKNIHTFNKEEAILTQLHEQWAEDAIHRPNVILMGDSLGDAGMSQGIPHQECLKIGFLNAGEEKSLEEYLKVFDVVLQNDLSMTYVIDLIESILNKK